MSNIPSLLLLQDATKRPLFDALELEEAHAQFQEFSPYKNRELNAVYSQKKLQDLIGTLGHYIDAVNRKIRVYNQDVKATCCFGFFDKVIRLVSGNYFSITYDCIDKKKVLKEVRALKSALVIQRAYRHHFRKKLAKEKQTYEEWQIKKLQSRWGDDSQRQALGNLEFYVLGLRQLLLQHGKTDCDMPLRTIVWRVLKIKEFYSKTHYVFTHGQSLSISLINQAVKASLRLFSPKVYHPLAPSFRIPGTVPHTTNIADFFKKYDVDSRFFNNNTINIELLSVDGYMWNTNAYQSALDFLTLNDNICTINDPGKLKKLFLSIFGHYVANDFICANLADKFNQLNRDIQNESKIGVLYAICVPKVFVQDPKRNFVYRAHPLGLRCSCHPKQFIAFLERMQNNETQPCVNLQKPEYNRYNPQYRLLTAPLMADKNGTRTLGVRAIAVDSFKQATRLRYEQKVQKLIQALHLYGRLFNLKKAFTPSEEAHFLEDAKKEISENKELDTKILVPLIRRRCREGLFTAQTKDELFSSLGVQDSGSKADEYWIGKASTMESIESVWSAITSVFNIFKFW